MRAPGPISPDSPEDGDATSSEWLKEQLRLVQRIGLVTANSGFLPPQSDIPIIRNHPFQLRIGHMSSPDPRACVLFLQHGIPVAPVDDATRTPFGAQPVLRVQPRAGRPCACGPMQTLAAVVLAAWVWLRGVWTRIGWHAPLWYEAAGSQETLSGAPAMPFTR